MFSAEEVLLMSQVSFKGWHLKRRCDRCRRQAAVQNPRPQKGRPVLECFVARVRCRGCRGKPSAALLTNLRDPYRVQFWTSHERSNGDVQVMLWAPRND
jgi:hypothetical protein